MMQANPFSDLIPAGRRQQPLIPQAPPPRTADQAEHDRLSNVALGQQIEANNQHLDPATVDMLAHQYILAGPQALQGVGGMGRTAAANRMAILNRAAQIAGTRPGENVQVGFARYRNGVHALQNLENQMGTISTNEQNASGAGEQLLGRIREVYPPNSTRPGNIVRGAVRDIFNSPAMTAYDSARNTFLTEYAKVVAGSPSGSGVLSDAARHEQQENLRRAASPEAAQAAIDQMRRDMAIRLDAFRANIQRGYTNLENGVPVAFHPNGDLLDERGAVIPLPQRPGAPSSGGTGGAPGGGTPNGPGGGDPNQLVVDITGGHFPTSEAGAGPDWQAAYRQARQENPNLSFQQFVTATRVHGAAPITVPHGDMLDRAISASMSMGNPGIMVPQVLGALGLNPGPGVDAMTRGEQDVPTLGFRDELAGLARSAIGGGSIDANIERERAADSADWENHPYARAGGELAGSLALPMPGPEAGMLRTMGASGAYSTGYGFGSGEGGAAERAPGAVVTGVAGTLAPPILSGVGKSIGALGRGSRGLYRLATGENPELAPRTVNQAFIDDANTPAAVAAQMQEAHGNSVPMMAADTGDNARGMLAATARAPGAARTMTREALRQRQEGLPERVTAAIERDLGPASNPHEVSDQLSQQAASAAAPLYDAAYARPGADAFVQRMGMLNRPSMQSALQRASRIAAEEGRDPNTMGFDINSSGEVSIGAVPSWQTLDYVKRGLDDVIERYRDPTTGRLNLDTEGRAVNNTQRSFLQEFDEANPDYAAARAAYAGPTRGVSALRQGLKSLNMTADDLSARINRMTPYEQEMFRLGHRRAMVEQVASRGDQSDMVNALIGTGKRREALSRLYGDNENFPRFVSTLQAEQAGHQTFRQAMLGSPTAANVQNDAALPGAATAALTDLATTGGLPIATGIRQAVKLGVTRVGRNAQEQISSLLSENNPTRINELARIIQNRAAWDKTVQSAAGRISGAYGIPASGATGNAILDIYGR